jgi:choline dehydrogenase-like flavoprotein
MLLDAADADRGRFAPGFDACVVGAGPAGITLARRLAARGRSVVLMEAGGATSWANPRTSTSARTLGCRTTTSI